MNVILIPGGRPASGSSTCLSHGHIVVMAIATFALAVVLGTVTYQINALLDQTAGPQAALSHYKRELASQRATLKQATAHTEAHLNALAQRLGSMQAQVLRLNALGLRLTRMAGLDAREFNFETVPAMGGPEKALTHPEPPDVGTALERLARELERSEARLQALEGLLLDRKLTAQITPSTWPAEGGWISSGFGARSDPFTGRQSWHEGVDIAVRFGSQVFATGDGVVTWSGERAGYGLLVEITHASGLVTRYAHLSDTLVKVGDRITGGQAIARIGTSGRTTGPHLHFEVVRNGQPVNPARYLQHARP